MQRLDKPNALAGVSLLAVYAAGVPLEATQEDSERVVCRDAELYDAKPDCNGTVSSAPGGGVKCDTCPGWFCY